MGHVHPFSQVITSRDFALNHLRNSIALLNSLQLLIHDLLCHWPRSISPQVNPNWPLKVPLPSCLVVEPPPMKNMKVSWDDYSQWNIPNGKINNVPNHQPASYLILSWLCGTFWFVTLADCKCYWWWGAVQQWIRSDAMIRSYQLYSFFPPSAWDLILVRGPYRILEINFIINSYWIATLN